MRNVIVLKDERKQRWGLKMREYEWGGEWERKIMREDLDMKKKDDRREECVRMER